jgi:hypothetical protein
VLRGGDDLGPLLTEHPGVDKVSFTGSTATGIYRHGNLPPRESESCKAVQRPSKGLPLNCQSCKAVHLRNERLTEAEAEMTLQLYAMMWTLLLLRQR